MAAIFVSNVTGRLPAGGEFGGFSGDCNEYSVMVARCAEQPQRPCDDAELNRLTSEAIGSGEAAPTGAMTPAQQAWLLNKEAIPYSQTLTGNLITQAQAALATHACTLVCTNGQALPGNEPGVQGHCIALLDWNGADFIIANGDSSNGRAGLLDHVTPQQVAAAQPYALTILEAPMSNVTPVWDQAAGTLTYPAHDGLPVIELVHAQAAYAHPNRAGYYPLAPEAAINAEGDGAVVWSDCQRTVAVKANNWAITLEVYAAPIAHALAVPEVDTAGIIADAQAIITKASI